MKDEGPRRPQMGDVLPGEAGVLVRDALRAARHTLSLGRRRLEASPVPGGEAASALLSRVVNRAEGEARRIIEVAFQRSERPLLASDSIRAVLGSEGMLSGDERIAFVRAVYRTLRETLDILGAPKALVLESAIEAALSSALPKGQADREPEVFPARFAHQLMVRRAVSHVVVDNADAEDGDAEDVSRHACFALGLAMTAELGEPVPEAEAGALVAAACAMTLALRDEVRAAADAEGLAALYRTYGAHV